MLLPEIFDHDQMVPEFDVVSRSSDSGATVLEGRLIADQSDLDSLLADINSAIAADQYSTATDQYITATDQSLETLDSYQDSSSCSSQEMEVGLTYRYFSPHAYTEDNLSLYDDIPTHMIKKEKPDDFQFPSIHEQEHTQEYSQEIRYASAPMEPPQTPLPSDGELEKLRQDVEKTCRELGISPNPYDWSEEDVRRWARRTLQEYQLPEQSAEDIHLDGTSLCMLTDDDFKARWPQFGEYIAVHLLWWKNATMSLGATQDNEYEETPTYTDLSNMSSAHQHHEHHYHQHIHIQHHQHHQLHHQQHQHHQHQPHHHVMMEHQPPPPAYVPLCSAANTNSMLAVNPMETLPINIPKPVFSTPISLSSQSPSPSPSIESSASTYNPSPRSYVSEQELFDLSMSEGKEMTPTKQNTHLWQFLRELLLSPRHYGNCIRWLDRSKGIFKIEDSARVATLWGRRKNRPAMNYDKLSRSIRQYYKKNIIKKTDNSKRLVYQFCAPYRA